jgi:hypothetical protein
LFVETDLRYQQRFDAQTKAIDAALLAAEKAIGAALIAAEKAVTKAEVATEKRFEGVNEFRQTLSDQTATFVSRVEFEAQRAGTGERIRELASRIDKTEGRSTGLNLGWAYLCGAAILAGSILAIILKL